MTTIRNIAVAPSQVQYAFDFHAEIGHHPPHDRRVYVVLRQDAVSPLKRAALRLDVVQTTTRVGSLARKAPLLRSGLTRAEHERK